MSGEDKTSAAESDGHVVIRREEFVRGAPMEMGRPGVRDLKAIYPETGFPTKTLILGIVEVDPGHHSPLHRHNCEEVYYCIEGEGEVEVLGERHRIRAGDCAYNAPGVEHRVWNVGDEVLRLCVVGGIMLVALVPEWPTASPYEVLEELEP